MLVQNCNHEWDTTSYSLLNQETGCPMCAIERRRGDTASNWKGGITPLHIYIRTHILEWKKDSMKSCNYKCDITGGKFDDIHHKYGFGQILQETIEILNLPIYQEINQYTDIELKSIEDKCLELHYKYGLGVCLCEEEHKLFHSVYGYGDNTTEQYEEFKNNRIKELNRN